MILLVHLRVKFRFMGFTIGTVEQKFPFPVPSEALPFVATLVEKLQYEGRGVLLKTTLLPTEDGV